MEANPRVGQLLKSVYRGCAEIGTKSPKCSVEVGRIPLERVGKAAGSYCWSAEDHASISAPKFSSQRLSKSTGLFRPTALNGQVIS